MIYLALGVMFIAFTVQMWCVVEVLYKILKELDSIESLLHRAERRELHKK